MLGRIPPVRLAPLSPLRCRFVAARRVKDAHTSLCRCVLGSSGTTRLPTTPVPVTGFNPITVIPAAFKYMDPGGAPTGGGTADVENTTLIAPVPGAVTVLS